MNEKPASVEEIENELIATSSPEGELDEEYDYHNPVMDSFFRVQPVFNSGLDSLAFLFQELFYKFDDWRQTRKFNAQVQREADELAKYNKAQIRSVISYNMEQFNDPNSPSCYSTNKKGARIREINSIIPKSRK